jgi:hypothetical protein
VLAIQTLLQAPRACYNQAPSLAASHLPPTIPTLQMSLESDINTLVPETLLVPPAGSSPISKLPSEVLLAIAEYLDSASCLMLSKTCRTLLELSKTRSVYWRSAHFAHGHLPRVAEMANFTGSELRFAAVKNRNLGIRYFLQCVWL